MADLTYLSEEDLTGPAQGKADTNLKYLSDADLGFGGDTAAAPPAPFNPESYGKDVDFLDKLSRLATGPFAPLARGVRGVMDKMDPTYRTEVDQIKQKMASAGEQPASIDQYGRPLVLDEDGNPQHLMKNPLEQYITGPIFGGVETALQGLTGMGGLAAQGVGAAVGALTPGMTAQGGAERAGQLAEPFMYKPMTSAGRAGAAAFEMGLPKAEESLGEIAPEMVRSIPFFNQLPKDVQTDIEARAHALGVSIPQLLMTVMMGAHGPQGAARARGPSAAEAMAKLQELQSKKPQETPTPPYRETADIFGGDFEGQMADAVRPRTEEIMRQRQQDAQGELRTMQEQQQFERFQRTGTNDMFDPALNIERGLEEPGRGGGEIPASEFNKFKKEFHDDQLPMTKRTADLFDVERNPQLLQDHNPETFKGLDFWKSRLEDENLFFDKAAQDPVSKRLDQRLRQETEQLRSLQEQMSTINQESVRLKKGEDIVRMKQAEQTVLDMQQAIGQQIGKINRLEETFRERMAALYPSTRSEKGTTRKVYPDRAFTGNKLNSFDPLDLFGKAQDEVYKARKAFEKIDNKLSIHDTKWKQAREKLTRAEAKYDSTLKAAAAYQRNKGTQLKSYNPADLPEHLKVFRERYMSGNVKQSTQEITKLVNELGDKGVYKFDRGDKVVKDGQVYEILGRTVSGQINKPKPVYRYRTPEGDTGFLNADSFTHMDYIKQMELKDDLKVASEQGKANRAEAIKNLQEAYGISPEMAEKMLDFMRENDMHRIRAANPAEFVHELIKDTPAFGAFKKALVDSYGKEIEPYAKALYEEAKKAQRDRSSSRSPRQEVLPPEKGEGRSPQSDRLASFIRWDKRSGDEMSAFLKSPERPEKDAGFSFLKQGQANSRRHPIMSWVYDKVDMAERSIVEKTNEILYGQKFVERNRNVTNISSLRRVSRTADKDSALYEYHQLKEADKSKLIEIAEKFNGIKEPSRAELVAEGFTPIQIKAYENLRKGLDKLWDEVITPTAEKLGVELPKKIPGFFPHTWFGDYRVWGFDPATGKREFVHGVSSMKEATVAIKELSKKFPQFEFKPEEVTNAGREFTGMADAFIDAIRLLGSNSTDGKAMTAAMQEILTRRGYAKHFKEREGILGAAGTFEEGKVINPLKDPNNLGRDKRVVNWERSYENYIKSGVRYAHNKELLGDLEKVLNDPDIARDKYPNAVAGSRGMLDAYLGVDRFLDKPMKDLMIALGQSTHLPENTIRSLASIVMYEKVMMARAPFYMAQAMQDMFTIPRLQQLQGMGLKGNMNYALTHGLMDWLDGSTRKADIEWAVRKGIIEPKFSEQILFLPHLRGGKMNLGDNINMMTGNTASAALDQTTRLRSYLTFLNFAESAGLKGMEAREAAAKNSLDVMVEYEGWKRSPMFREMGKAGGMFSPLTTFTNNLLNRITEYTKEFGVKNAKPILTMAGMYLLISGIYGMPFRDDVDSAIDAISKMTGIKLPTITDGLISISNSLPKKAADIVMFGLPSGLSGWQVGGSLGSPEIIGSLIPSFGDPLPKLVKDLITTLPPLVGNPTNAEKMAALKTVSPTAPGHGMIENSFSPSTQGQSTLDRMLPQSKPVLTPGPNMEGKYIRSPQEQYARLVGVKSNDETLLDMKKFRKTQHEVFLTNQREKAVGNMVDAITEGRSISPNFVQKYVQNGGDANELLKVLKTKTGNRYTTYVQREVMQAINALNNGGNPRNVKLLQEYGLTRDKR